MKEGQKCERSEDYEGAIDNYTKALATDYSAYLFYYMRGCVYEKMGELEKAAADFKAFLLKDSRVAKLGTTPWGFAYGAVESAKIGTQRSMAQLTLTQVTFQKILNIVQFSNPLTVDYSNKRLYNWKSVSIADTSEKALMQNEAHTPQEVAYRKGVKCLLQGKHEKAIHLLGEAIEMNPEDFRPYLFRGIVYSLRSGRKNLFGSSRSKRELNRSKFESDLDRALLLSNGNKIVEQWCNRTKDLFIMNEHAREEKNPLRLAGSLAFGIFSVFAFLLGSIWMIVGVRAVVEYAFYARLSLTSGVSFMVLGALVLFGGFSIYRRKRKRGIILIIAGILILFILVALEIL